MSIYGNNQSAFFQFDKVFSNRKAMDEAARAGTDHIFVGRFVLVSYNELGFNTAVGYYNDNKFYADITHEHAYQYVTFTRVDTPSSINWENYYYWNRNKYFKLESAAAYDPTIDGGYYTLDSSNIDEAYMVYDNLVIRVVNADGTSGGYKKCTGGSDGVPTWETFTGSINDADGYIQNYAIDRNQYGTSFDVRGYDGTIWTKVFTEKQGRFILVARMNGDTPAFDIVADPPSLTPTAPYIGNESSQNFYVVHTPSYWGFQVKAAPLIQDDGDGHYLSNATYTQVNYDGTTIENVPADIYFNKPGLNPMSHTRDDETPNEILVTPTGKSGKTYSNGIVEDRYELSIHLPALGNAVSDVYDVIYSTDRRTDVDWQNHKDRNDASKTYDLSTVAGSINTLHSKIGQIIDPIEQTDLDLTTLTSAQLAGYDPNIIYKNGATGMHYRIGTQDFYTEQTLTSQDISYSLVNMNELIKDEYFSQTYYKYVKSSNYVLPIPSTSSLVAAADVSNDPPSLDDYQTYLNNYNAWKRGDSLPNGSILLCQKNIARFVYDSQPLLEYEADTYYYLLNNNYYKDTSQTIPTSYLYPYYKIDNDTFVSCNYTITPYAPQQYYTKDAEKKIYYRSNAAEADPSESYYLIDLNTDNIPKRLYRPNVYYYYDNGTDFIMPQSGADFTKIHLADGEFFAEQPGPVFLYSIPRSDVATVYIDANTGQPTVGFMLDYEHATRVTPVYPPRGNSNLFYTQDNNTDTLYHISTLPPNDNDTHIWYTANNLSLIPHMFIPNTYYTYNTTNQCYILANTYGSGVSYLTINPNNPPLRLPYPFYRANKYYYMDDNDDTVYYPDNSDSPTKSAAAYDANGLEYLTSYFVRSPYYVKLDVSERWPEGFEWKTALLPRSITQLAKKVEGKKAYTIENINDGTNSLNGIILQMQNLLNTGDAYSRDIHTIQGVLNTIQDLLVNISLGLQQSKVLYVNDFGQIAASNISIKQLEDLIAATQS